MAGVVVLAVVIAVVVAVTAMVRSGGDEQRGGSDGAAVRRFFQYLLAYGLMVVVAMGVSGLVSRLFEGPEIARSGDADLARSFAFTLVGVPLYAAVAAWSRRRLRTDPSEARSLGWLLYSTVAPLTALVAVMVSAHGVLSWALGAEPFDPGQVGGALVWAAVWAFHWMAGAAFPARDDGRVHRIGGSLFGLVSAAVGLGSLLSSSLQTLYETVVDTGLVAGGTQPLREAVATSLVGGAVWLWYWFRHEAEGRRTGLWNGYVLLVGVAGGLVTAVIALSTVIHDVLVWTVGDPASTDAARHFEDVPGAAAGAALGLLVWWYHRTVLGGVRPRGRGDVDRLYEYVMAGVGLVAAAAGITTVLVAIVEAATPGAAVEAGEAPVNTLLAAVTLLAVGGPVWWVFWRRIERAVAADTVDEVRSLVRRVYLFVLFGVGGVVAVSALVTGAFIAFEDILEGTFGSETLHSTRVALSLIVTTGTIAAYHWAAYRADRRELDGADRGGPSFVLLVGVPDDDAAEAVKRATGATVRQWRRTDAESGPWDVGALVEAVTAAAADEVVVVSGADGLDVVPVDRSRSPLNPT